MRLLLCGLVGSVTLCATAHAASVNLLTNGDFEDPYVSGSFDTIYAGSSIGSAWLVNSGSVDQIGSGWVGAAGTRQSIDLDGYNPATISQSFSTIIGQSYTVQFYIAGNPGGFFGTEKTMDVSVANVLLKPFTFDTAGHTASDMGWEKQSFTFIGTGSDTLIFASTDNPSSNSGMALDQVSVALTGTSPVPLPASAPMFGAALLGLAGLGYAAKRKKAAAAA